MDHVYGGWKLQRERRCQPDDNHVNHDVNHFRTSGKKQKGEDLGKQDEIAKNAAMTATHSYKKQWPPKRPELFPLGQL